MCDWNRLRHRQTVRGIAHLDRLIEALAHDDHRANSEAQAVLNQVALRNDEETVAAIVVQWATSAPRANLVQAVECATTVELLEMLRLYRQIVEERSEA